MSDSPVIFLGFLTKIFLLLGDLYQEMFDVIDLVLGDFGDMGVPMCHIDWTVYASSATMVHFV